MNVVDAHHHFWDTTSGEFDYDWMTDDLAAIRGRFGPAELQPALTERGVGHTVLVQTLPSVAETEGVSPGRGLDRVRRRRGRLGGPDRPGRGRDARPAEGRPDGHDLVGIRHQAQDEPDPDWLADPRSSGLGAWSGPGSPTTCSWRARELPAALALVRSRPECPILVGHHIAKPNIREHEIEPWASGMRALTGHPNVWVKVSGMIEEADWTAWRTDDLRPYVDMVPTGSGRTG